MHVASGYYSRWHSSVELFIVCMYSSNCDMWYGL